MDEDDEALEYDKIVNIDNEDVFDKNDVFRILDKHINIKKFIVED